MILLLFLIGLETDLERLLSVAGSATAVASASAVRPRSLRDDEAQVILGAAVADDIIGR